MIFSPKFQLLVIFLLLIGLSEKHSGIPSRGRKKILRLVN